MVDDVTSDESSGNNPYGLPDLSGNDGNGDSGLGEETTIRRFTNDGVQEIGGMDNDPRLPLEFSEDENFRQELAAKVEAGELQPNEAYEILTRSMQPSPNQQGHNDSSVLSADNKLYISLNEKVENGELSANEARILWEEGKETPDVNATTTWDMGNYAGLAADSGILASTMKMVREQGVEFDMEHELKTIEEGQGEYNVVQTKGGGCIGLTDNFSVCATSYSQASHNDFARTQAIAQTSEYAAEKFMDAALPLKEGSLVHAFGKVATSIAVEHALDAGIGGHGNEHLNDKGGTIGFKITF